MSVTKKLFGNWKMNVPAKAAEELAAELGKAEIPNGIELAVFPSFLSIEPVRRVLGETSRVKLGAQDCFWEDHGAFTGEISPAELAALGARYVLVGHSERREYLCEDESFINRKVKAVLENNMTPVLCIGESAADRQSGRWPVVLERELNEGLDDLRLVGKMQIIVAYEPIWAVGTGEACRPEDAAEAHGLVSNYLVDIFGEEKKQKNFSIIYGGSVDAKNIKSYFSRPDIDGALVGGASQKWPAFSAMLKALG